MNICDIRFRYRYDNPFPGDATGMNAAKLKDYINDHGDDFNEIDYLNDSHWIQATGGEEIIVFGEELSEKLIDNKQLTHHVATYISRLNQQLSTDNKLCDDLVEWAATHSSQGDTEESDTDTTQYKQMQPLAAPTAPMRTFNTMQGPEYDMMPFRQLNYASLCAVTVEAARAKLGEFVVKDSRVQEAEYHERQSLLKNLEFYRKDAEIERILNISDPNRLTLSQLRKYLSEAESIYATQKIVQVSKDIFGLCGIIYDYTCPNGIKIGKNRAIKFNNVGQSIQEQLFGRKSAVATAFRGCIQKYNLEVSDEFTVLFALGKNLVSNIEVIETDESSEEIVAEHSHDTTDAEYVVHEESEFDE